MFDCPYCHHSFTTKQRLVSHLSRNNKCYDVNKIGMPPILLDLMGLPTSDKNTQIMKPTVIVETKEQEVDGNDDESDIDGEQKSADLDKKSPLTNSIPISDAEINDPNTCTKCLKVFANQKNLEKHNLSGKCGVKKPKPQLTTINDKIPLIFKSKEENKDMAKRIKKTPNYECTPHKQNIRYIVRENYMDCLTEQLGSQEQAYRFVRNCIQCKIRGAINLLYKIYFEGKRHSDYPIEIVDSKGKKLYYKTPNNVVLDENAIYVKTTLVDNIRNCYLQFCNHIITENLEDNDVIFDDYDLAEIQKHILELSDEKKKDRIILGLMEQSRN